MESLKKQFLRGVCNFVRREEGLVTVEWVALTAAMVIAAVLISYTVMENTNTAAATVGNNVVGTVNAIYGPNGSNLTP